MRLLLLRCLLDPVTTIKAVRRTARSRGRTSFDVAWRHARVERFPDEAPYQRHAHRAGPYEDGSAVRRPDR